MTTVRQPPVTAAQAARADAVIFALARTIVAQRKARRAVNGSSDSTVLKGEAAPRASTRPETRITSSEKTASLY
jgi:hypothetical protein